MHLRFKRKPHLEPFPTRGEFSELNRTGCPPFPSPHLTFCRNPKQSATCHGQPPRTHGVQAIIQGDWVNHSNLTQVYTAKYKFRARGGSTMTTPQHTALLQLDQVNRIYGQGANRVHAVRDVSLNIPKGRMVALMGPSGSGKTTLLNMMGGLDRPTKGRVLYEGVDIQTFSGRQALHWRRRELGFIFQSFALLPTLSAVENVEVGLHIAGVPFRERRKRAAECLDRLGLTKRLHQSVLQLSGGEQQRVAIARALAHRPRLILADEPTGELDVNSGLGVLALFRRVVDEEGTTICMVTHDPKAQQFADVTYHLLDGRIVDESSSQLQAVSPPTHTG